MKPNACGGYVPLPAFERLPARGLVLQPARLDAGGVTESSKYAMDLGELVDSARVPRAEQIEEQDDVSDRMQHDEAAGHPPGNVRPYGA